MQLGGTHRRYDRLARATLAALLVVSPAWLFGCALRTVPPEPAPPPALRTIEPEIYHRAEVERANRLEAEVERLRADLKRAEDALVLAESGLRGSYNRADAVSSLAETRIRVERAAAAAPWRVAEIAEAQLKLEEASSQIEAGHFGASLFFIYRARRISDLLQSESKVVASRPDTLFINGARVNMRSGPSMSDSVVRVLTLGTPVFVEDEQEAWKLVRGATGSVGWIHADLLAPK